MGTLPLYPVGMIRSPSSPRANATTPEPAHPAALRRCLGPLAVTAQGIAAIGLSGTAVINIPQIIASAGNSTWLAGPCCWATPAAASAALRSSDNTSTYFAGGWVSECPLWWACLPEGCSAWPWHAVALGSRP